MGRRRTLYAYNHAVLPSEDCYRVQLSYEIPPGSDVSCNEDAEREDRKWVHEPRKLRSSQLYRVYGPGYENWEIWLCAPVAVRGRWIAIRDD
jgi:hypothetical protein